MGKVRGENDMTGAESAGLHWCQAVPRIGTAIRVFGAGGSALRAHINAQLSERATSLFIRTHLSANRSTKLAWTE